MLHSMDNSVASPPEGSPTSADGASLQTEQLVDHESNPDKERTPKTYKSAVCIIPPCDVWDQIQEIRAEHDKSYVRWMPHINMLYPFVADIDDGRLFQEAADRMQKALMDIKPFRVEFSKESFNYFVHKKSCTLWLRPAEEGFVPKPEAAKTVTDEAAKHVTTTHTDKIGARVLENKVSSIGHEEVPAKREPEMVLASQCHLEDDGQITTATSDMNLLKDGTGELQQTSHNSSNTETEPPSAAEAQAEEFDSLAILLPDDDQDISRNTSHRKDKKRKKKEKKEAMKTKGGTGRVTDQPPHPVVMELQRQLEATFPEFTALSEIGEHGFQPHLSLGQFQSSCIAKKCAEFADQWTDISFDVTHICLISRADYDDPFHIRHRVPLGTDEQSVSLEPDDLDPTTVTDTPAQGPNVT